MAAVDSHSAATGSSFTTRASGASSEAQYARSARTGATGFSSTQVQVLVNPSIKSDHRLLAPLPFGVFTYGNGNVTTYAYPGGMALGPIAAVNTIVVDIGGGTQQIGTPFCVTAGGS